MLENIYAMLKHGTPISHPLGNHKIYIALQNRDS